MQRKLLGIINVHFDAIGQLLIIYSVFVKYLRKWEHNEAVHQLFIPYPTAFPYGNGMVLHFYQLQESSTNKTVHKVINRGLKTYV